jgi:glycosyltransferase involved in cell wall biosynthesis
MNIIQVTPGAGAMYCGNCLRDNALVAELRRQGHAVTMVPLYLPVTLDEVDQSAGAPVFFGGINVYLDQKLAWFRRTPNWLRRLLSSERMLRWAQGRTARTRATEVGDILLSMLRGEEGHQARELDELLTWLRKQPRPDLVCLSNSLLTGMARRLKAELRVPVVCTLQGEDSYLDALPESHRAAAWQLVAERAADVDLFIAPSRYFADLMTRRLGLPPERVRVIHNGINLEGFRSLEPAPDTPEGSRRQPVRLTENAAPVLGYFARLCPEKGLDTLVEAFIEVKRRERVARLKLHIGGGCGPGDEPFVKSIRQRLAEAGFIGETSFSPNPGRAEKIAFFEALTVFSVPARYGEAFGLYLIEAFAAGVPVAQPRTASFSELVEATGGGVLCEPGNVKALADAIEALLLEPRRARALGEAGSRAVRERFSVEAMTDQVVKAYATLVLGPRS